MRKKKAINYRARKKSLGRFHVFGFKNPHKGKDFTPQQKSAITRQYNKLREYLSNDEISFIKYPKDNKLKGVDGVRTNKGLIYKHPFTKAEYSRKDKKYHIVVTPEGTKGRTLTQKRRDVLYLFPKHILGNPQLIMEYIDELRELYKPEDIRWSTVGKRESVRYDAAKFAFYFNLEFFSSDEIDAHDYYAHLKYWETSEARPEFYNGVFLVYYYS